MTSKIDLKKPKLLINKDVVAIVKYVKIISMGVGSEVQNPKVVQMHHICTTLGFCNNLLFIFYRLTIGPKHYFQHPVFR
jgi:hypothetical protein